MPRLTAINNFKTELSENISDSDTNFDLDEVPSADTPYRLTIRNTTPSDGEIIEVTSVSGNTITVERGKENTTAQSWDSGSIVEQLGTAGMYNDLDYLEVDGGEW